MTITAKYPSKCSSCNRSISIGEKIEWTKGSPVRHTVCPAGTALVTPAPSTRRAMRPGKWTGCSCGSREDSYGQLIPARNNCRSCEHDAD